MAIKRYSKQRELIYEVLLHSKEHPTAEMVYKTLKPEHSSLSLGTVYRNLNQLVEEGTISSLPFTVERFDANTEPHAHFSCDCCRGVFDIMGINYDASLDKEAGRQSGHSVDRHMLIFHGVCKNCSKEKI